MSDFLNDFDAWKKGQKEEEDRVQSRVNGDASEAGDEEQVGEGSGVEDPEAERGLDAEGVGDDASSFEEQDRVPEAEGEENSVLLDTAVPVGGGEEAGGEEQVGFDLLRGVRPIEDSPPQAVSEPVPEDDDNEFSQEEMQASVQQVSLDVMGFSDDGEDDASGIVDDEGTEGEKGEGRGSQKVSFSEIRSGKKTPRLKKNMILVSLIGFLVFFIIIVNVALSGKKKKDIVTFEERDTGIKIGKDSTTLGDYVDGHRARQNGRVDDDEDRDEDVPLFLAPPDYDEDDDFGREGRIPPQYVPPQQGARTASAADTEREQALKEAIRSSLRKDGGYGDTSSQVQTAEYQQIPPQAYDPFGNPIMSYEQYMQSRLPAVGQQVQYTGGGTTQGGAAQSSGYGGQSDPGNANNGRYSSAGAYNPNNSQAGQDFQYLDDNCLFPGTIIHAILVSRIDTDYPAPIHARVVENVYDSKTGKNLLIPQGTILQGNYSSSSLGVNKVQIAWESMVVNYAGVAYQVSLGGMAGVDKRGRAGVSGFLDDHYFEWLKAAGIVSLFTMFNSEVSYQMGNQRSPQVRELMDTNQALVNELGARIMNRALDIQPTVRVPNGKAVSVSVNAPLVLRPFPPIMPEEKYTRRGFTY